VAGGVAADRWGRKGAFLLGVALFGLGALAAGAAPSVPLLLAGRVAQGVGPALLVPGSLTILRATFADPRERAAAIGLWSTSSGLALAVGPALGGLVVDGTGWRGVFLLNVPLAAVLGVLAARYVPRLPPGAAAHRFDWLGALLTTSALAALAYALIDGQHRGWTSGPVLAAAGLGLAGLVAFAGWERRAAGPLVDVRLFARPAFTAANLAALVVFFAFVGGIVYLSAYFQQVQGRSPVASGLEVSVMGMGFALAAPVSGRLVGRVGPRGPMLAGLAAAGLATLGLLRLRPDTGTGAVWWDLALVGAGAGLCLTPMTAIAVSTVDAGSAGMASAVHNALRQVGQVLGVAVLGALVYGELPGDTGGGRRLDPAGRAAFVSGLHRALAVSGLALLAAALLAALVLRGERHG
jgi:DHA2 family methylenomycin A resistance protein-like MFS transporter